MKNHWLKRHENKKRKIWTAEFSRNAIYSLRPRRVDVFDAKYSLGYLGQTSGTVAVSFLGAMFATGDMELMTFLSDSHHKGMSGQICTLRQYQGISVEIENYELSTLDYGAMGMGHAVDDIKFTFGYRQLRHFHVA